MPREWVWVCASGKGEGANVLPVKESVPCYFIAWLCCDLSKSLVEQSRCSYVLLYM